MKKIMSIALMCAVVLALLGCPQPNDSGNGGGGGGGGAEPVLYVTATIEGTVLTVREDKTSTMQLKEAIHAGALGNRENITSIVIEEPASGVKVIPEENLLYLFNFSKLESLTGLEYIDTSNVTSMASVFYNCKLLEELNLSTWSVANVTNMIEMFYGCTSLNSLDLSTWNTAKVTVTSGVNGLGLPSNGARGMFVGCFALTKEGLTTTDASLSEAVQAEINAL